MNEAYIASLICSTLRMTTPILFATLACAICTRANVFNVALEGQMLVATFAAIAVNYYTKSVALSVLAGALSGALVGLLVAVFQVKFKAKDMIVGTSVNLLAASGTSYIMYALFKTRGTMQGYGMVSLTKINFKFLSGSSFLSRMLENLTVLDYVSYLFAIAMFIYLFKTVSGFHMMAVGINKTATESLGTKAEGMQMAAVVASGALCGLGGVALCMGNVTMFTESMTSGRGYIALAASSLAGAHPLGAIASSLFFGASLALSKSMQNLVNSQITVAFPYIATIVIMAISGLRGKSAGKRLGKKQIVLSGKKAEKEGK